MNNYFFVLGRSIALCRAEFEALCKFTYLNNFIYHTHAALAESAEDVNLKRLISGSGGIVKCGLQITEFDNLSSDILIDFISEYLEKHFTDSNKISLGLSIYGKTQIVASDVLRALKKSLKNNGINLRFVIGERGELSSVQIDKYGLVGDSGVEFVLIKSGDKWVLGKTNFAQPYQKWSKADYGRPRRDAQSGMLPPKVARMMVNLGLSAFLNGEINTNLKPNLFDPFCGSGTVLTEALRMGLKVSGSDLSEKAVNDTVQNLSWILEHVGLETENLYNFNQQPSNQLIGDIFKADVSEIYEKIGYGSVDIIVTEPYMGPLFEREVTPGKFDRILKGLEKLYIGAFKSMYKVLVSGGILVFSEPEFYMYGKSFRVGIIDNAGKFGYTLLGEPVVYKRERAYVGRRIGVLIKK